MRDFKICILFCSLVVLVTLRKTFQSKQKPLEYPQTSIQQLHDISGCNWIKIWHTSDKFGLCKNFSKPLNVKLPANSGFLNIRLALLPPNSYQTLYCTFREIVKLAVNLKKESNQTSQIKHHQHWAGGPWIKIRPTPDKFGLCKNFSRPLNVKLPANSGFLNIRLALLPPNSYQTLYCTFRETVILAVNLKKEYKLDMNLEKEPNWLSIWRKSKIRYQFGTDANFPSSGQTI